MRIRAVQAPRHHFEKCPTCGGEVHERVYGEMYAGAFISNGRRLEIRKQPHEHYADPIVLDTLTQYFDGQIWRMWPSDRYFSRSNSRLHRAVWTLAFGPIPGGCHIHHKDGEPANNALSNLECLPASEHLKLTWKEVGRIGVFSEKAKAGARAWHKSPEGLLWHRRHAQKAQSWTKWKREKRACLHCKKSYLGIVRNSGTQQKYCCTVCKHLDRNKKRSAATVSR